MLHTHLLWWKHTHASKQDYSHSCGHTVSLCLLLLPSPVTRPPDPWPHCDIMEHYSSCSYSSYLVLSEEEEERDWAGSTESLGLETWRSRTSTEGWKEQKGLETWLTDNDALKNKRETYLSLSEICIYVQFTPSPSLRNQGRVCHVLPFLSNRYFVFHSNVANHA